MYGAIIGDLAGSIYEYKETKCLSHPSIKCLIPKESFISDDTILTIAILDAFIHNKNYKSYLKEYILKYKDYLPDFKPYFKTIFSPNIIKWAEDEDYINGKSIGNGCMMRISSIGMMSHDEDEVKQEAHNATIPTHDTPEAIECATIIALVIFYLKKGLDEKEILKLLNISYKFKTFDKFNKTCYETLDNCLYVLFKSSSFDDAIKKAILLGGDTDTNAAIVGSMAEAMYGIDDHLINEANKKLPKEFIRVLKKANNQIYIS